MNICKAELFRSTLSMIGLWNVLMQWKDYYWRSNWRGFWISTKQDNSGIGIIYLRNRMLHQDMNFSVQELWTCGIIWMIVWS